MRENKKADKNDIRYKGVRKQRNGGRDVYYATIYHNGENKGLGCYHDPKVAAKAYDMYVIRFNLNRKTNFFKKKLA